MAIRYLRTDLERIRSIYNDARTEYTRLQDELTRLKNKLMESQKDFELTVQGKDAARMKYNGEIAAVRSELDSLISKTSQSFSEVREDVDKFFGGMFRATPEKLDTSALELLKSGILTDAELSEMAEKYADNATMRRMIGKYAQERADKDRENVAMRQLALVLNRPELPHLEAADTLIMWCEKGLREDRVLSDGIARAFDEQADSIIAQYGDISVSL